MLAVLPFKQRENAMKQESRNENLKPRSIHLPVWLWEFLDKDAKRCKRSATKQLEALLTLCYDPEADIEINRDKLDSAFHAVSQKRPKVA
jgi:hypothetical protein